MRQLLVLAAVTAMTLAVAAYGDSDEQQTTLPAQQQTTPPAQLRTTPAR